jgi:pimeloyl-ACP methyl ester carboxylesterase
MASVSAPDGTEIAYKQAGNGPPIVLVHGGGTGRSLWNHLRPQLVADGTVIAPDRRGHGDSGDADQYSLDREVADVRAVVDAVEGDPVLFGHSFGGLCSLEAARDVPIERLILYEPALLVGDHRRNDDLAGEMTALIEAGKRRQAIELYFREAVGADDADQPPIDSALLDHAEIIIRQNRAVENYRLDDDLDVSVPTLLLMSEHGPEHLRDGVRTLHDTLSDSRLVELEGMGHAGISSAPERVAREIRSFVSRSY